MSRSGWSASNFLRYSGAVVSAAPLTIAAWAMTSISGSAQRIAGIFNSGTPVNNFYMGFGSGNTLSAATTDGSSTSSATTSTTLTTNTWFHACAVFASATSRSAYLNGGGKVTETTSRVPSGLNRTSVGLIDASSQIQPFAPGGTGLIAEVAIWNIALNDAEVLALSKGLSPLRVHPEALVAYWPLLGRNSPENNYKSNTSVLTMQGTLTQAVHPRIIMPRRRRLAVSAMH